MCLKSKTIIQPQEYYNCIEKREELAKRISELEIKQFEYDLNPEEEEHVVRATIFTVWKDYQYLLNGVLYRWDKCRQSLDAIIDYANKMHSDVDCSGYSFPLPDRCDQLSYEFENFIISVPRLNEEQMLREIRRHLTGELLKEWDKTTYKREDVEGLFWKIYLLRNRSAHSTGGYYQTDAGVSKRFLTMTAKIHTVEVSDKRLYLNTLLIDLAKSDYVKSVIKNEIENNTGSNIMDILFKQQKPKGQGKNNSLMLWPDGFPHFDLNRDFLLLSEEIFDYISAKLYIISDAMDIALCKKREG